MKLYYIANARIPTEKAHGIQIAKMCEAFIEAGVDVTLVIPRRQTDAQSAKDYYKLRVDIPVVRLFAFDWYTGGRLGYLLSTLSFMLSYLLFVWNKKRQGERFMLYTVDLDNYSSSALAYLGAPLFSEMHGAKENTLAERVLFQNAAGIIAINRIIVDELKTTFSESKAAYLVEPNGVDLSSFEIRDKHEARVKLGLPPATPIVLYAGQFFAWKGLDILAEAAALTPDIRWQMVGGDRELFKMIVQTPLPENFFFAGTRPHSEMPLWLAASDVLVVLGTANDIQSYRYTSPMKLFEYLAAGRPIVASKTPAICEIVSSEEVTFYEPDNARSLAEAVSVAKSAPDSKSKALRLRAENASWQKRAERIVHFMQEHGG